jgi:hypothetical protein
LFGAWLNLENHGKHRHSSPLHGCYPIEDLDRRCAWNADPAIDEFCDIGKSRGLRSAQRRVHSAAALQPLDNPFGTRLSPMS